MIDCHGVLFNRQFPILETEDERVQRFYRIAQKDPIIYQVFQKYLSKNLDLIKNVTRNA